MTPLDLSYVKTILDKKLIHSPVLELGSGYGGDTCRELIKASGIEYYGTDLTSGQGVDIQANFENDDCIASFEHLGKFSTILILNVLEHTFNPLAVLDNAFKLVKPGGTVVVLTPAVWPLHSYPFDAYRILPNFYETYSKRRGVELLHDTFEYVGYGKVADHRNSDGSYRFPYPYKNNFHQNVSRFVHRLFDTPGRGIVFKNHIAVACVFRKPM